MTATTLRPSELLPPARHALMGYVGSGGHRALAVAPAEALETLLATSLRGLGGARFPFADKLAHVLANPGPRAVICNAAEDEPGSQKDRALLERNPHLVIEGAVLAAQAAGAETVIFYVRASLSAGLESLRAALSEVAGDPLMDGVELLVREAPTAYVAGEASAAVRFLSGGEAKPKAQPPYPTERGLDGRPTLLSNCETLANLPRIINGESNGNSHGDSVGFTRLATVTGDVLNPGVYEITPQDTTLADLVALAGGLPEGSVLKAIQPGGPSTAYLPASAADTRLTDAALIAAGSSPGCLAVRVLSDQRCIVEALSEVTAFFASEQCGQCPPCRMKTQAYDGTMQRIRAGQGTPQSLKQLAIVDDFVSDLPRRCSLISMPDAPVRSAGELFPNDFTAHFETGTCAQAQP